MFPIPENVSFRWYSILVTHDLRNISKSFRIFIMSYQIIEFSLNTLKNGRSLKQFHNCGINGLHYHSVRRNSKLRWLFTCTSLQFLRLGQYVPLYIVSCFRVHATITPATDWPHLVPNVHRACAYCISLTNSQDTAICVDGCRCCISDERWGFTGSAYFHICPCGKFTHVD